MLHAVDNHATAARDDAGAAADEAAAMQQQQQIAYVREVIYSAMLQTSYLKSHLANECQV